jgi:hypothetical protein
VKATTKQTNVKTKLKHTSSTSSVESLSRARKPQQLKPAQIKKRNVVNESRATTKARRLQRASSREALLQSHGSSSEDLGATVEVPQRKPRQIKKTKATQLNVNGGVELKKGRHPTRPDARETSRRTKRKKGNRVVARSGCDNSRFQNGACDGDPP